MTSQQTKINDINQWIKMNIIPNRLQLLVGIEEVDDIDFDVLQLVDITYKKRKTVESAETQKEFHIMVHHFEVDKGKVIELEIDFNQELNGIYALDNYKIDNQYYLGFFVTSNDGNPIGKLGLEGIMNYLNYDSWFYDNMVS